MNIILLIAVALLALFSVVVAICVALLEGYEGARYMRDAGIAVLFVSACVVLFGFVVGVTEGVELSLTVLCFVATVIAGIFVGFWLYLVPETLSECKQERAESKEVNQYS